MKTCWKLRGIQSFQSWQVGEFLVPPAQMGPAILSHAPFMENVFSLILSYLSHFGSLQAFLIFARPFSQSHSGLPCLLHGFQGWTRCSWSRTRDLNAQEIPKIRSWWSWWFGTAGSMAFRFTTRRAIWPKHSQASHRLNLQIGFDMKVEHQYVEEEIPACVNFCSCVLGGYDLRLASVDLTSVSDSKITWTKQ